MTSSTRTLMNAAARGSLKTKTPEEALELLESLASQEFDNAPAPVAQRRAGIMKLDDYDAHATEDCEYIRAAKKPPAEVNGLWHDQKNQNQHPGLSHKSNHQLNPPLPVQPHTPQQSNTSEWEKAFAQLCKTTSDYIQGANAFREDTFAFMQESRAAHRNQEASIRNLEIQIGQLSKQFSERAPAEKKLFKWEKKKALERQNKPLDLSPYARIPYPQRLKKDIQKQQFMKDLLSRKRKLQECEMVNLTEECNAIIQKKLPTKVKDPGSFNIPCTIGKVEVDNVLCDLGASINVMPLSIMKKLGITKVDKFIIPVDFVILDIEEDATIPMIFGRPFLATSGALIDVLKDELILRVDGEQATFKFFDKEVPSSVAQPEDQVYFISE
ncbi:uncharacterized protein LOC133308513 [Gastrolobium bilobum]|uniref:uncharacterized protein LOC133308513 n=1 Tax=Gastrolobium bilobum TaxID=150636 RepID=UPI002AB0ECAD|nr:uncharacterized protein LOC133308513 [Gastrolobium bilobum]